MTQPRSSPNCRPSKRAIAPFRSTLEGFALLDGTPRQTVVAALQKVEQALNTDLSKLVSLLTGEELIIHFDWNP